MIGVAAGLKSRPTTEGETAIIGCMKRLLLISNSTNHGEPYLDHCMPEIVNVLDGASEIGFVPFALHDRAGYAAKAVERFAVEGIGVREVTADEAGRALLEELPAIFVGGGNTFRLLKVLHESGLLPTVRQRVGDGMVYMGASAGSNIAAPSIKTTNDMPIVQPPSFDALGLVSFQINPHYLDSDLGSKHMGETRQQRLVEFLEENDTPVVGLREGAWIHVAGEAVRLGGRRGARIFRRGCDPEERPSGAYLNDLGS